MSAEVNHKLAEALRAVGLHSAASLADEGYFGDATSPLAGPKTTLCDRLFTIAEKTRDLDQQQAVLALRKRVMGGDFDG